MNYKIYKNITREKLFRLVPPEYKGLSTNLRAYTNYDCIVFSEKLVTLDEMAKVLKKYDLQSESVLCAFGKDFTTEARELLKRYGGFTMSTKR